MTFLRYSRRSALPVLAALVLALGGCDAGITMKDPVFLTQELTFRFSFDEEDINSGKLSSLRSEQRINLDDLLEDGYTKDDIKSANVALVELVRGQPAGVKLNDIFSEVNVLLSYSEQVFELVASADNVGAQDRIQPRLAEKSDPRKVLTKPNFEAVLEIKPRELTPATYVLTARMVLTLEMRGS